MKEGLARRFADIDSDVETLDRRVLRNNAAPDPMEQLMHRIAFLVLDVKITGDVPPWQHKRMQWGDRRRITHGKGERVGTDKPGLGERTEDAGGH